MKQLHLQLMFGVSRPQRTDADREHGHEEYDQNAAIVQTVALLWMIEHK